MAQKLGFNDTDVAFADGKVRSGNRAATLSEAARDGEIVVEDGIEFGELDNTRPASRRRCVDARSDA